MPRPPVAPDSEPATTHAAHIWAQLEASLRMGGIEAGTIPELRRRFEALLEKPDFAQYPVRGRHGEAWAYMERLIQELTP